MMGVQGAVRTALGGVARTPPFSARTRRAFGRRVNILYAHYVGAPVPYYEDFYAGFTAERLDETLSDLGRFFSFTTLEELLAGDGAERPGRPLAAVTFDDGFDIVRSGGLEVLESHGIKATMFVITATIDNAELMWRNKLSAIHAAREETTYVGRYNELAERAGHEPVATAAQILPASCAWEMDRKDELADELWRACDMPPVEEYLAEHRPYLTWDGLRQWLDAGQTVGLHTRTHPFCARLSPEMVKLEIDEPAEMLRARLGLSWLPLSYPFGSRLPDAAEREAVERGVVSCALGIRGLSPRGTPSHRLERANIEADYAFGVFAKPFLGIPR